MRDEHIVDGDYVLVEQHQHRAPGGDYRRSRARQLRPR